ncbi:MAG: hypothetical protein ACI8RZ_007611, partial [Myxococcota bacterium]
STVIGSTMESGGVVVVSVPVLSERSRVVSMGFSSAVW